jgi:hypothetical protein
MRTAVVSTPVALVLLAAAVLPAQAAETPMYTTTIVAPAERPLTRAEVSAEARRALLSGEIMARHVASYGVKMPLRPEALWRDTLVADAR